MKKLLGGFLILIQILILFGCEKESKDTRLIFKITLNGSAVSGCRVDVYGSSSDQSAKTNRIAYATSGADGKVTFTDCSPSIYYVDFVYNNIIYYSTHTDVLTLNEDNIYNVTLVKDTRLIFHITMNGSVISGCRVNVYANSSDQSNKTNLLAYAISGSDGVVTFTGCSATVYYIDFVYNDVLFYSDQTSTLTIQEDNVYNVTLYSMTLTLNNDTYTPIKITVQGSTQKTIPVGGSLTYTLPDASSVYVVGETYEVFNDGVTQLGQKISWNCSVSTPNNTNSVNLGVASTVCYFRIQNNGTYVLGPIYFNYGNSTYQYFVNAPLPTGGGTYNLGYYQAVSGGEMRAYYYPSTTSYTYWIAGTHFTYPNTDNQLIKLTNTYKGVSSEESSSIKTTTENLKSLNEYKPIKKTFKEDSNTQLLEGKILE